MKRAIELRCTRDLALRLGAIVPDTVDHHRQLRDSGQYLQVRDTETGWPLFWLWMGSPPRLIEASSE